MVIILCQNSVLIKFNLKPKGWSPRFCSLPSYAIEPICELQHTSSTARTGTYLIKEEQRLSAWQCQPWSAYVMVLDGGWLECWTVV